MLRRSARTLCRRRRENAKRTAGSVNNSCAADGGTIRHGPSEITFPPIPVPAVGTQTKCTGFATPWNKGLSPT